MRKYRVVFTNTDGWPSEELWIVAIPRIGEHIIFNEERYEVTDIEYSATKNATDSFTPYVYVK